MKIVRTISEVRDVLDDARRRGRSVGFVPTMGALHDGHRSLVRRAREENDLVCVSIFVNPTQFGPNEDLDAYPRPLDDDLAACEHDGVDIVFVPDDAELYPRALATSVRVSTLTDHLEGAHRPGHFDGVTLIVTKLFNIVGRCRAYFGEKDAQQLRVIRRMVSDLNIPVHAVGCRTVREADGLAMSSRNAYLEPDDRERARCLSQALFAIRDAVTAGERDVAALLQIGHGHLKAADEVDYLAIADPDDLHHVDHVDGGVLVLGAVRIGSTRLIDNVPVDVGARPRMPAAMSFAGRDDDDNRPVEL